MTVKAEIRTALKALYRDRPKVRKLFRLHEGKHERPYMPETADAEFKMLAQRSVTNLFPLLIDATAQALYVDDYRHSTDTRMEASGSSDRNPYWNHWQASRMDARQGALYRAALICGQSFALTERRDGKVRTVGLSSANTATLYELGDWMEPVGAIHVETDPQGDEPGVAYYWDERYKYTIDLGSRWRAEDSAVAIVTTEPHGARSCPVTRLYCYLDLEGRATGLIEPLIPAQNRMNQSVFDLLVKQTYESFQIRWATGMAPPVRKVQDEDGEWVDELDANGNPIIDTGAVNARRVWFGESPDTKFGAIGGGDLSGIIQSIELAMRQFTAAAQIPPHYMLGEIVNVNAEALKAAAVSLERKNSEIATALGEAIERVMRVAGEIEGLEDGESDHGEVVWRDLSTSSLAQTADALGKMAESLGIPVRGLWGRVPNVTREEKLEWERLADQASESGAWGAVFDDFDRAENQSSGDGWATKNELANG